MNRFLQIVQRMHAKCEVCVCVCIPKPQKANLMMSVQMSYK